MDVIPQLNQEFRLVLADLPYGITSCEWDNQINLTKFWRCIRPFLTKDGSVLIFSTQPFTTDLVNSNREMFKYVIVWKKNKGTQQLMAKKRPMSIYEEIVVFQNYMWYNPQWSYGEPYRHTSGKFPKDTIYGEQKEYVSESKDGKRYPQTIIEFDQFPLASKEKVHPTQKPVDLLEYLIKSYSDQGDFILDPTAGSGSIGVACKLTNRGYVGIEIDKEYYEIAKKRLLIGDMNEDYRI